MYVVELSKPVFVKNVIFRNIQETITRIHNYFKLCSNNKKTPLTKRMCAILTPAEYAP